MWAPNLHWVESGECQRESRSPPITMTHFHHGRSAGSDTDRRVKHKHSTRADAAPLLRCLRTPSIVPTTWSQPGAVPSHLLGSDAVPSRLLAGACGGASVELHPFSRCCGHGGRLHGGSACCRLQRQPSGTSGLLVEQGGSTAAVLFPCVRHTLALVCPTLCLCACVRACRFCVRVWLQTRAHTGEEAAT